LAHFNIHKAMQVDERNTYAIVMRSQLICIVVSISVVQNQMA